MNYTLKRIIIGVVIGLVLMLARKAMPAEMTFHTWSQTGIQYNVGFGTPIKVRVKNPSASVVTVSSFSVVYQGQTTYANYNRANWGNYNLSSFTVPAGGYTDRDITLELSSNTSSSAGPVAFNLPLVVNAVVSGVTWTLTKSVPLSGTQGSPDARSMSPNPYQVGEMDVAAPPPLGKITIVADSLAAGPSSSRSWSVGEPGTMVPQILVEGSNVVLSSSTPAAYSGTVRVYQTGLVIGSAPVVKDSFGNFDVTVNAVGAAVVARITVNATAELQGSGQLIYQGYEGTPNSFLFTGVSTNAVFESETPFAIANGAAVTVQFRPTGSSAAWQTVGSATITKDTTGGWNFTITCSGESDSPEAPDGFGKFGLDVTSYEGSEVTISLTVDGVTYAGGTITGDSKTGSRKILSTLVNNAEGIIAGKAYTWNITGIVDGVAVNNKTIASGTTSATGFTVDADPPYTEWRFTQSDVAMIGQQKPDAIAPNDYDPSIPPEPDATPEEVAAAAEKKSDYEVQNKAASDALNDDGGTATADLPDDSAGKALGADIAKSNAAFAAGAGAVANLSTKGASATYGTQSSLTVTFPKVGAVTIDAADYGYIPGIMRTIALMFLLWHYYQVGMGFLRSSTAN